MLSKKKYSFLKWLLLSVVTIGIYHIYHQYILATDLNNATGNKNPNLPFISLILTAFAMTVVADAIMQSVINKHFGFDQL